MPLTPNVVPTTDEEWKQYAELLRAELEDPTRKVLLDAEELNGGAPAVFELPSGVRQRQFVLLWRHYADRDRFRFGTALLAARAREIRQKHPFTTIVTCSPVVQHLIAAAHADIERGDELVTIRHLHRFPFIGHHGELMDFANQRVLVVCDMLRSGATVRRLLQVVHRSGGETVAILSLVRLPGEDNGPLVTLPTSEGRPVPTTCLTDLTLLPATPDTSPNVRVYEVDPDSLAPQLEGIVPHRPKPARTDGTFTITFSEQELFNHLEGAKALDFDFYRAGRRLFTSGVRIDRLLASEVGDQIWAPGLGEDGKPRQGVGGYLPRGRAPVLVTTFDRADQTFADFVVKRLANRGQQAVVVHVANHEVREGGYFLLPQDEKKLANQEVVVLFASVHTADKVRHLASLLAQHNVIRVRVVCLLNRMGKQAMAFAARIERLLRGVRKETNGRWGRIRQTTLTWLSRHSGFSRNRLHTVFEFRALYDIREMNSEHLERMRRLIDSVFSRYRKHTRVPGHEVWADHERKYFAPHDITAAEFVDGKPRQLSHPFKVTYPSRRKVEAKTEDGRLALLSSYIQQTRDYSPAIELIRTLRDKRALYRLFGLLLADVNYLRQSSGFKRLRGALIARLERLREDRIAVEALAGGEAPISPSTGEPEPPKADLECETWLLFGLALFAANDPDESYKAVYETYLAGPNGTELWPGATKSLLEFYANDTAVWAVSLLIVLSRQRPREKSSTEEALQGYVRRLLARVAAIPPETGNLAGPNAKQLAEELGQLKSHARANLDRLLTELGGHELKRRHQVIRYLHTRLLTLPRSHNFIERHLYTARSTLQEAYDRALAELGRDIVVGPTRLVKFLKIEGAFSLDQVQAVLEDALHTANELRLIAKGMERLYLFTPAHAKDVERYTASAHHPGFSRDVDRLNQLLFEARRINVISQESISEIDRLVSRITYDLFDDESPFRKSLQGYVVDLLGEIESALIEADKALAGFNFLDVWARQISRTMGIQGGRTVLIEKYLLQEVLRNIFKNVRHSFTQYELPAGTRYADLVDIKLTDSTELAPDDASEPTTFVDLIVSSQGRQTGNQGWGRGTLGQQRLDMEEYGGNLTYRSLPEGGAEVTLRLITRDKLRGVTSKTPESLEAPANMTERNSNESHSVG